jgi:sugar lactone lactonase YvrE
LNGPTDVIVDKQTDSLIICDRWNQRVMRWPRRNGTSGETIIKDIDCYGLTIDDERFFYVSDKQKHEVRRYRVGETNGTVVAGGNGRGDRLNQLNSPDYVFVDRDYSVYVSDVINCRVMKWAKGAKEGIVVAGGRGRRDVKIKLSGPRGVFVDQLGAVYVADNIKHRVTRWYNGPTQGNVIAGGNGKGQQEN